MKTVLFLAVVAACGGKSSKPTTPVVANPDPAPPTTDPTPDPGKPDPAKVKADLLAAETAAYEKAKPVFEANCSRCHAKGGRLSTEKKRDHFDMTTYPFGGHHAAEIAKEIRKSLGIDGSKPRMPFDKKGSVQGEDLKLIAAWADAFDAAHAGGAHEDHGEHKH